MMTAKASPLSRPTISLAPDERPALARAELARRERAHRDRHGLGAALPPWQATMGSSMASATIFSAGSSKSLSTDAARNAVHILANSQLKRPLV